MSLSILHFADLHLDASFSKSLLPPQVANECREQLRKTLSNLVDLAKDRHADVVTIAGDLFDRDRLNTDTAAFIVQQLGRLHPIPVFIAPGNRDPADAKSIYQRGRWPENVNIALSHNLTEWPLSADFSLWAAAHLTRHDRINFLEKFQAPLRSAGESRGTAILLLHGKLSSEPAPTDRDSGTQLFLGDVRNAGFALALLGHWHTPEQRRESGVIAVYPGSPEPLSFEERDAHGAMWLELEAGQEPKIEFLPTAKLRFEEIDFAIDQFASREQLVAAVPALAAERKLDQAFVRLRLTGNCAASLRLNSRDLANQMQARFRYLQVENATSPDVDLQALAAEQIVRGAMIRALNEASAHEPQQRELYDEAQYYGLQAFAQGDIILR